MLSSLCWGHRKHVFLAEKTDTERITQGHPPLFFFFLPQRAAYFYITLFHCLNVSLWATKPSSTCPELILYYRSFQAGEIVQTLVALASERWAVRKSRRGETQGISCTLPLCFSLSCFLPQVRGHWRAAAPPAVGSLRLCALLGAVAGLEKEKEKKKLDQGFLNF